MARVTQSRGALTESDVALLTVPDLAKLLRVCHGTVRLWDRQGRLRRRQLGRAVRYSLLDALRIAECGLDPPGTHENRSIGVGHITQGGQ